MLYDIYLQYCGLHYYCTQGFSSRTLSWDGSNIVLPDGSGRKVTWWDKKGQLVYKFAGLPVDDYIVCTQLGLDQSVLWVCGVSSLVCLSLSRNDEGNYVCILCCF